jgi:hypothetical protein
MIGDQNPRGVPQPSLEVLGGATSAPEKPQPPSGDRASCPIINIASPSPSVQGERDRECCREAYDLAAQFFGRAGVEAFNCPVHGLVPVASLVSPVDRVKCSLELHMVRSEGRPGYLSLWRLPTDQTWWPVFEAMNQAGFRPGDVVRLSLVRRGGE